MRSRIIPPLNDLADAFMNVTCQHPDEVLISGGYITTNPTDPEILTNMPDLEANAWLLTASNLCVTKTVYVEGHVLCMSVAPPTAR